MSNILKQEDAYLDTLSCEIFELLDAREITTIRTLLCASKTMEFILHKYFAYYFLEKHIGNRYKCPQSLPCSVAWHLFATLIQPNCLSNILNCSWFQPKADIIVEILNTQRIYFVLVDEKATFIKYDCGKTWFTVPNSDIDYYLPFDGTEDNRFGKVRPLCGRNEIETTFGDAELLVRALENDPIEILKQMFIRGVMSRDENKNIHALVHLMDMTKFESFTPDKLLSYLYHTFYAKLGDFPLVCEKIINETTTIPLHMISALKNIPHLLKKFLCNFIDTSIYPGNDQRPSDLLDTKFIVSCASHTAINTQRKVTKLVRHCIKNGKAYGVYAEHVIETISSMINIEFLLPEFHARFFSCGSLRLLHVVLDQTTRFTSGLDVPILYIKQEDLTKQIYACVKTANTKKLRVLLRYKNKFPCPSIVQLSSTEYPQPTQYTKHYAKLFGILREYSHFVICKDLETYFAKLDLLGVGY